MVIIIYWFQGYILGNAATFPEEDNYAIPFAHGMGLISDELYQVSFLHFRILAPVILYIYIYI